ncbi:hypothetical protein IQ260_27710 [Leptolyngbya cf. ectocarpi LEGE 11479]|uniref:Uncharacterized protein n=1 Tax=Leptolyngbya cf. ectocarpi LEGE 11479 TaxID=1828722 RepID=A0A928ZZR9_LEPEC|nr:hypothetical protein [Leptolyngbya ectocarpi]MBE9070435.1 hypothetical protein [Leptolyngbya cf. ectocarpi LEGE 11479]
MRLSLSVLSVTAAISVFHSLGLTISIPSLQAERGSGRIQTEQFDRGSGRIQAQRSGLFHLSDRGSGRIQAQQSELFHLSDRGSGRGPAAYRGSGRISTDQAYRGSGRLIA